MMTIISLAVVFVVGNSAILVALTAASRADDAAERLEEWS